MTKMTYDLKYYYMYNKTRAHSKTVVTQLIWV